MAVTVDSGVASSRFSGYGWSQQGGDWRAHSGCGSGSLQTFWGRVARDGYTKSRAGCFPPLVVSVRQFLATNTGTFQMNMDGPELEPRWGARLTLAVQTGSEAHPASCTMGTGSFPRGKRSGRGVNYPPPSSAVVKERVKLYPHFPSASSLLVIGRIVLSRGTDSVRG